MDNPSVTMFISIVIMLALLAAAYTLSRKMGGASMGSRRSKYMKSIDRLPVAKDRWIEMVQVGDAVMIVGVTSHKFEVLKTVAADELAEIKSNGGQDDLFKNILGKVMNRKP